VTAARGSSMREVARLAGVSVSTVANVLSRPAIVAPETRRRVQGVLDAVGYVPNGPARQLRGVPSPIVGSVTLDLANPFYAEVNRGIEDGIAPAGCLLLAGSTDLRPDKEEQLLHLLEQQGVRGVAITPATGDPDRLVRLTRRGIPVVLLDQPRERLDLCAVAVDDVLGGRLAAEHLIALGHRNIAFLGSVADAAPVGRRRDGARQALAEAGLGLLDVRVATQPPPLLDAAAGAVRQILSASPRPTAVLALNDTAAMGLLDGLLTAGVRVPADISVVGYDDLPLARRLPPPLTTVRQPHYDLGRSAAELLLDEGRPGHVHREIRFQPSLVVRQSTAPPPA
jgi:LacI family transcriptional regulator